MKKAAMLKRLGLLDRAEQAVKTGRPWHLDHVKEGDTFTGSFNHPLYAGGEFADIKLTVLPGGKEIALSSAKAEVDDMEMVLEQDFPIRVEDEYKNDDMAEYCLHKFNMQWRKF